MRGSDVAYEKLKMMIITAQLKPGQALVEPELM
ncbi:MAG TPA: GntR family transcriptional regulator, partial [Candidatus Ventrisoma faecale]|nr:GntR family transcriptional regulator [Candidatus Ventrisoma faecale]